MAVLSTEEMGQGRSAFYLAKWNSGLGGGAMLSFFFFYLVKYGARGFGILCRSEKFFVNWDKVLSSVSVCS